MWSTRRGPQDAAGLSKPGAARRHIPAVLAWRCGSRSTTAIPHLALGIAKPLRSAAGVAEAVKPCVALGAPIEAMDVLPAGQVSVSCAIQGGTYSNRRRKVGAPGMDLEDGAVTRAPGECELAPAQEQSARADPVVGVDGRSDPEGRGGELGLRADQGHLQPTRDWGTAGTNPGVHDCWSGSSSPRERVH